MLSRVFLLRNLSDRARKIPALGVYPQFETQIFNNRRLDPQACHLLCHAMWVRVTLRLLFGATDADFRVLIFPSVPLLFLFAQYFCPDLRSFSLRTNAHPVH